MARVYLGTVTLDDSAPNSLVIPALDLIQPVEVLQTASPRPKRSAPPSAWKSRSAQEHVFAGRDEGRRQAGADPRLVAAMTEITDDQGRPRNFVYLGTFCRGTTTLSPSCRDLRRRRGQARCRARPARERSAPGRWPKHATARAQHAVAAGAAERSGFRGRRHR